MLRVDRFVVLLALAGLLVSGCRTYGGYDSKPKMYQAMQRSVEGFADDLNRAEADFRILVDAAEESDTLQSLVDDYQAVMDAHKSLLEKQRHRVEQFSASSGYRTLHREYGATVTEQRMIEQNYRRVVRAARGSIQETPLHSPGPTVDRQYTIRPANFPSLWDVERVTMEQALGGR